MKLSEDMDRTTLLGLGSLKKAWIVQAQKLESENEKLLRLLAHEHKGVSHAIPYGGDLPDQSDTEGRASCPACLALGWKTDVDAGAFIVHDALEEVNAKVDTKSDMQELAGAVFHALDVLITLLNWKGMKARTIRTACRNIQRLAGEEVNDV